MKRKDYLPFHAKIVSSILKTDKKKLYANHEKKHIDDYQRYGEIEIKNEAELVSLLEARYKISDFIFYAKQSKYLDVIFNEATPEQQEFFIANSNNLIGTVTLEVLNQYFKDLTPEIVTKFLLNGTASLGRFQDHSFDDTFEIIKDYPNAVELLNAYLLKNEKNINYESVWVNLREKLITHFPEQLDLFSLLPFIAQYLESQNNATSMFSDHGVKKTIYFQVDCRKASSIYRAQSYVLGDYKNTLKTFIKALEKTTESTGIIKVHVNESRPGGDYQFHHIYINFNQQNNIDEDYLKTLVHEYFIYNKEQTSNISEDSAIAEKWLKTRLFNDKLETGLSEKEQTVRKLKM